MSTGTSSVERRRYGRNEWGTVAVVDFWEKKNAQPRVMGVFIHWKPEYLSVNAAAVYVRFLMNVNLCRTEQC